jgi:hypothetical protein
MDLVVLPDLRVLHTTRNGEVRMHDPKTGLKTVAATLDVYQHDEEGLQSIAIDANCPATVIFPQSRCLNRKCYRSKLGRNTQVPSVFSRLLFLKGVKAHAGGLFTNARRARLRQPEPRRGRARALAPSQSNRFVNKPVEFDLRVAFCSRSRQVLRPYRFDEDGLWNSF